MGFGCRSSGKGKRHGEQDQETCTTMTVILPGMLQAAATTRIVIVQFAKDKETEGRMYTG